MAIELVIDGKQKNLGEGFVVRRSLPVMQKRTVGPFVFFDHMGPVDLRIDQGMDVRPHPHIGLSTLTYLFEGEIVHRDTLGFEQVIRPGAVNWMTAGRGIAHSERSASNRASHRRLHGIQTWLALPIENEELPPSFHHHPESTIPEISQQGVRVRVIAGEFAGQHSPVRVYSSTTYLEILLPQNASFEFAAQNHELAIYVVSGRVSVEDQVLNEGQLGVLKIGSDLKFTALESARVLVLGGEPLPEPRHIWWNFVSSRKDRIEKAKQDWLAQNFGTIRGETEFIPLPSS